MWGSTPLLVACEYGRQEFAELLLSHKCEVDTPNHKVKSFRDCGRRDVLINP
jgi:hypothetical protein